MTLNGTVTEFEWSNLHNWIRGLVPDLTGKPLQWTIQMNAPAEPVGVEDAHAAMTGKLRILPSLRHSRLL